MTAKATSSIQVIARLSRLLDALAAHDQPVSLKVLSSVTSLHPSTAFRILASLIEHGLVERSASGYYRLGAKLRRLAHRVPDPSEVHSEAGSVIERSGHRAEILRREEEPSAGPQRPMIHPAPGP